MPNADEVTKDMDTEEDAAKEEAEEPQAPLLTMANWKFSLGLPEAVVTAAEKDDTKAKMLEQIKEKNMTAYYEHLCETLGWKKDAKLAASMKEANDKELEALAAKEKDAKENLGDTEVREALLERADYLASIGEKDKAVEAYNTTDEKTVGMGGKIDISFSKIRIGLAWGDTELLKAEIEKAKMQVEKGGDWERRNLLGVYEATYLIITREFKAGAKLFLSSVSTFACYKLFDYNKFVFYTVVVSLVSLDRVTLNNKIIKSPEILEVIGEMPTLKSFLFSLYKCQYKEFFQALTTVTQSLKKDVYLAQHVGFLMRELRIVAYQQFLQSYKSVTLEAMAQMFGVSPSFVDKELSRFISAGRISCKIDKVGGIVETVRLDHKEAQYTETIKQGDVLLNRIQKLTKFINY